MDTNQIMQMTYLGLLAAAIGGSYIVANRGEMGKMAQQAAIWALIIVGTVAAYGLWEDMQRSVTFQPEISEAGQIVVPQHPDGHYYLTLAVNGAPVDFMIDTGASQIVLSQQDAESVGLAPGLLAYTGTASTANGIVTTAPVRLDTIALGPLLARDIPAVVNGGAMDGSLLGMTYLDRFQSLEFRNSELVLTP